MKSKNIVIAVNVASASADVREDLTDAERALVAEGLNFLEEHGAPALGMRGGTQRMDRMLEAITRKLRL